MKRPKYFIMATLLATTLAGCQGAYYGAMEKLGIPKRDILVDRVQEARDSQEKAKEQFQSALDEFIAVLGYQGGELEAQYKTLNSELGRSEGRANDVRERIRSVENVSEALFDEWNRELEQYTDASLRRESERKLHQTRDRYAQMIRAMRNAEEKMEPVLTVFRDQVLYLKHNLNAQAIASLQSEVRRVENNVAVLIRDMEASIAEADRFIQEMSR